MPPAVTSALAKPRVPVTGILALFDRPHQGRAVGVAQLASFLVRGQIGLPQQHFGQAARQGSGMMRNYLLFPLRGRLLR